MASTWTHCGAVGTYKSRAEHRGMLGTLYYIAIALILLVVVYEVLLPRGLKEGFEDRLVAVAESGLQQDVFRVLSDAQPIVPIQRILE